MNLRITSKTSVTYVILIKLQNEKLLNVVIVINVLMLLYFVLLRKVMKVNMVIPLHIFIKNTMNEK